MFPAQTHTTHRLHTPPAWPNSYHTQTSHTTCLAKPVPHTDFTHYLPGKKANAKMTFRQGSSRTTLTAVTTFLPPSSFR